MVAVYAYLAVMLMIRAKPLLRLRRCMKKKCSGVYNVRYLQNFQVQADSLKNDLLNFLIEMKRARKKVAAYGAAAKGNTLLNYAGVKQDLLPFVYDAASAKQGKYMPGSHIPILPPPALVEFNPDFVLILLEHRRRGN